MRVLVLIKATADSEAIEWVKRTPNPMPGPSEIEICPIFEHGYFGDAMTPEQIDQEKQMREELEGGKYNRWLEGSHERFVKLIRFEVTGLYCAPKYWLKIER